MFGILNVNKPEGLTSRRVVDRVSRLVRGAKAGHAGTLDPIATGVLVVCVGPATRLIPLIQRQPKVYRAVFRLGARSDTDDVTGHVEDVPDATPVTREQVEAVLPEFVGEIEQVPPKFSAVHVGGQRAYKLARRGENVQIKPKRVHVRRIEILRFDDPELELEIECGSGTYIRSVGRDLGDRLGCGAVMSRLVRTRIGPFRLDDAVDVEQLNAASLTEHLLPATMAVADVPRYVCEPDELDDVCCGRLIRPGRDTEYPHGATIAVVTEEGNLACLARFRESDGTLAPKRVFLSPR